LSDAKRLDEIHMSATEGLNRGRSVRLPTSRMRPRHQGGAHGGRAPAKLVRAPAKNNWTDHIPSGLPGKNFGIFGHLWHLKNEKDQMATHPCIPWRLE